MGRLQPSRGLPPAGFRRAARAKKAKATINQLIPSLLSTHPRARRGIDAAELIIFDRETGTLSLSSGEKLDDNQSSHRNPSSKTDISQTQPSPSPRITLTVADTISAARSLATANPNPEFKPTQESSSSPSPQRVAILNMASPLNPGGGFLNGATSQEESLCMRTTLLPSLRDHYYRLPDLGAIYTPDVLVFRPDDNDDEQAGDILDKKDRWFVDCISAAMLRNPETEADPSSGRRRYAHDKDRQLVLDKMKMVMRICRAKGIQKVVLGAWGCGAYGNPVGEVAAAWRKVLLPRTMDGGKGKKTKGGGTRGSREDWRDVVEEVIFAVKDAGMADAFAASFGEGLVWEDPVGSHEEREERNGDEENGGDYEDDDPEEANRAELRARIRELETRIQASANPQLKKGLHAILASLVNQLPPDDSDPGGGT